MTEIEGKPFTDVVGELEGGDLLRELTSKLYEVGRAVRETRKDGTITLAMRISPTGKSFVVDAKITAKTPEHDCPTTTFFMTPEGTLMRNDPDQPRLPLREVMDEKTGELRTVRRHRQKSSGAAAPQWPDRAGELPLRPHCGD